MKAVILAAGIGSRMQKAYPEIPKVMLPLKDKPLIEGHIKHLKKFGVVDFYINLHYLPKLIKEHLGNGEKWGVRIHYAFEPVILGTSGALKNFLQELNETFIVLYGDIFTTLDIQKFYKFHRQKNSQATLLVHQTDHPKDSDLIAINDEGRVHKFHISPHSEPIKDTNLSSAAIYILEPDVLKFIPEKIPSDFVEDFFPILLKKGVRLYGYLSNEFSKDIGVPERYRKVINIYEKR